MSSRRVRLISAVRQNIGGQWYLRGAPFYVTEQEAADLVATKWATRAPPEPEAEAPTYKRRDMRAEK